MFTFTCFVFAGRGNVVVVAVTKVSERSSNVSNKREWRRKEQPNPVNNKTTQPNQQPPSPPAPSLLTKPPSLAPLRKKSKYATRLRIALELATSLNQHHPNAAPRHQSPISVQRYLSPRKRTGQFGTRTLPQKLRQSTRQHRHTRTRTYMHKPLTPPTHTTKPRHPTPARIQALSYNHLCGLRSGESFLD